MGGVFGNVRKLFEVHHALVEHGNTAVEFEPTLEAIRAGALAIILLLRLLFASANKGCDG